MTAFYDDMQETAKEMIEEFGQSVTWQQLTNGDAPDPDKPWIVGEAIQVNNTVDIAFFDSDYSTTKTLQYITGTEVTEGCLLGYMAAVDFTPSIKDVVIRDGEELAIKNLIDLSPNGQKLLYTVEFKK